MKDFVSSTAALPPELLPARRSLPTNYVQTAARGKGKGFVWLRRVEDPSNFRQVLQPCEELAKIFKTMLAIARVLSPWVGGLIAINLFVRPGLRILGNSVFQVTQHGGWGTVERKSNRSKIFTRGQASPLHAVISSPPYPCSSMLAKKFASGHPKFQH